MTTAVPHVSSGRTAPLASFVLSAPIPGAGEWTNPREFTGLAGSEIEALGARIKVTGITAPLLVQQVRVDGKIVNLVIDGQRRFLGAQSALPKSAELPVVDVNDEVIELTPEIADQLTLKALSSIDREDLSSYELSTVADRMKARGKTLDYIGKAIHRDPSWVSKMLKARSTASKSLLTKWRKGEVTDEQFKELAAVTDQAAQEQGVKEVVDARKTGDKSEARVRAKELKERHAAKPEPRPAKPQPVLTPAEGGKQAEMFDAPKKDAKGSGPKPPSRVVLGEFLAMADKRPPTADFVKGLFAGVRYALGLLEPDAFGKAWDQYVARLEGRPKPAKKAKAGKKPKAPKKATKAKPSAKKKAKK